MVLASAYFPWVHSSSALTVDELAFEFYGTNAVRTSFRMTHCGLGAIKIVEDDERRYLQNSQLRGIAMTEARIKPLSDRLERLGRQPKADEGASAQSDRMRSVVLAEDSETIVKVRIPKRGYCIFEGSQPWLKPTDHVTLQIKHQKKARTKTSPHQSWCKSAPSSSYRLGGVRKCDARSVESRERSLRRRTSGHARQR